MTTGLIVLICIVIVVGFLMAVSSPESGTIVRPPPEGPPPDDPPPEPPAPAA